MAHIAATACYQEPSSSRVFASIQFMQSIHFLESSVDLDQVDIFEVETQRTMFVRDRGKQETLPVGSTLYAFSLPDQVWCLLRKPQVSSMFIPAVHVFPNEMHPAVQYERPGTALFHSDFIVKAPKQAQRPRM